MSAALVGDSLRASIRRSVVEQLGPIDEEVVRPGVDAGPVNAAIAGASSADVAKTLPAVAMVATVRGRDFVARVSQAQLLEVDFGAAQRFSEPEDPGIRGSTPSGDNAVMTADLSDAIAIQPGHRVTVYAFGRSRTFTIDRVLPRHGLAGLRTPLSPAGSAALNLFVPPGTVRAMIGADATTTAGQASPAAIVAIANRKTSVAPEAVTTALHDAAAQVGADVRPVRQQLLDDAARRSRAITDLFRSFAVFGALAGVALLVLALSMLGRDRVRDMGILRAYGMSRRAVVATLMIEGGIYAVAATVAGVVLGFGVASLVVLVARHVFQDANTGGVDLVFSARGVTVAASAAAVFVVAAVTIACTAIAVSRRNVVRAMRRLTGAAGVFALNATRRRWIVAVIASLVLIWSITVLPRASTRLGGALIVAEGLVMTACVLALTAAVVRSPRLGPRSHRRRATSLAVGYARLPSRRTLLVVATYAILLFILSALFTVREFYERGTVQLAGRIGGVSSLEVSSNAALPVRPDDVAGLEGVTRVKEAAAAPARIEAAGANAARDVTAVGIDASWAGTDPYEALARDSDQVVVGADLYADRQSGFPGGLPHVGDKIEISMPVTRARRTVTVGGIVAAARYDGADHVYLARPLLDELLGSHAVSNLLFVDTKPGVNADVLASVIDGTHLPNGAYARSFVRLARESNSAQAQFLDISAGYAAVGLLPAIVAIAIFMFDRVRDRQRQIASLRAFGLSSAVVRRSVRIETGVIALAGMLVGIACGVLLAWRVERTKAFAAGHSFGIPLIPLVGATAVVLIASVLAANAAARRASRLRPAYALRFDE